MRFQKCCTKNIARNVSLILFFFLGLLSFSTGAAASTLIESYEKARGFDPIYKAIEHETNANQEIRAQALSSLLPTVQANYSETKRSQDIVSSDIPAYGSGSTSFPITDYGLTVNQSIYSYKNWARFAEAKLEQSRLSDQFIAAEQDLMMRLSVAYLDVLNANEDYQSVKAEG